MDALGVLGSLGGLGSLIPNLEFVGAYRVGSVATWKFGIASVWIVTSWAHNSGVDATTGGYYPSGAVATPVTTMLVVPGSVAHPGITSTSRGGNLTGPSAISANVTFNTNSIIANPASGSNAGDAAALLFNY